MNYAGIDLHKESITVCVMNQERKIVIEKKLICSEEERILKFFISLGEYEAVVEATSSYEWLVKLLEPSAHRVILAHPKKLRVIAESVKKSDKLDARVLAEFLALGMIPEAHRPLPRQRDHRVLVRHRAKIQGRITSVKCRIRNMLARYNADRKNLFTPAGRKYLREYGLSKEDRYSIDLMEKELEFFEEQFKAINARLKEFAKKAPIREKEARALLKTIPGVGEVTINVVVAEAGDMSRFRSAKKLVDYAGLAPGYRSSAGKSKELGITKEGSGLMRWALTEAAWSAVRHSSRWRRVFERLAKRRGRKKAIVAVARHLLCVMHSMLQAGQKYNLAAA
jgi:transposase